MQRNPTGQHESAHAPRRWCRWLLASVAAALALVAWQSVRLDARLRQQPVQTDVAAAAPATWWLPVFGSDSTTEPLPEPESAAAPSVAVAGAVAALNDPIEMEICGSGMVRTSADAPYRLQSLSPSERAAEIDRIDALMLADADERVRAAALLIGARSRGDQTRDRADRLARLAVGSQDPAVYAMALEACHGLATTDAGACQLLSRAHWVRLDPDNVFPWLELAAEAQDRFEPDAQAEAMRHAALARRSDAYESLLPELVDRTLGSQAAAAQRALALGSSWNVQLAWVLSHSSAAYSYCASDAALGWEDRQHSCEALAQTLAQRKLHLADLGIGLAIDKGLGWSAERLQAMQQANAAINTISGLQTIGLDLTCDGVARMQGWLRELDARGELHTMRELLARGGRSAVLASTRAQDMRQGTPLAHAAPPAPVISADAHR